MRIIAGRFGGRRLQSPPGTGTRPTSDRVREALFSALGPLDGAAVLDLFAGTGALGLEALSRGASTVRFVERDRRAALVLRANLDALGVGRAEADVRVGDARAALREASARGDTYDLVLLDPPYREAPRLAPVLASDLPPLLAAGARVVTETDRRSPLELGMRVTFDRRYGDTLLRIHAL